MAEGTAPAAPAPVNGTTPTNGHAPATDAKAPDLTTELNALLTKYGGLKFKAGNKEHVVKNPQALLQALGEGAVLREKATGALTRAQQLEAEREKWEGIKKAPKEQRWRQLADMLGEDVLNESAHAFFSEAAQREAQAKQLTPRERQLMEEAEKARREADSVKSEAQKLKQAQEEHQARAQYEQKLQQYDAVLGEALESSGATPEMAPYLVPALGAYIDEAERLGLEVQPQALAREAFTAQVNIARNVISRLAPETVLALLEEIRPTGEDGKPGKSLYFHTMVAWNKKRTAAPGGGEGVAPTPPQANRDDRGRFTPEQKQDMRASLRSILSAKPRLTVKRDGE